MAELDKRAAELGIDLRTNIAGVPLSNPLMTASGTFSPHESSQFYDISELGAAVTKGVSADPWEGNPTPRIAEAYGGVLNSVGLENKGAEWYRSNELPFLEQFDTRIITNLAGHSVDEYVRVTEKLNNCEAIDLFELNISCPNVSSGGMAFGTDPDMASEVVRAVRKETDKPLIVKLTPNVTDITVIAQAVEDAGADAVSLINTLLGMAVDLKKRKAVLARTVGGFSGPAVKPVALRMVWQTAQKVKIPVIGIGGINSGTDVVEFLAAGASAVGIGTAALMDPCAMVRIKSELIDYMDENRFADLQQLKNAFDLC